MVNSRKGSVFKQVNVNGRNSFFNAGELTETSVACPGLNVYPSGFSILKLFYLVGSFFYLKYFNNVVHKIILKMVCPV